MSMNYNDGILLGSDLVWDNDARKPWEGASIVHMDTIGLRIVRVALIQVDFPLHHLYDVSYILGMVGDTPVYVHCPFGQWDRRTWKSAFIQWGIKNRVFVKGLGIFDDEVIRWGV